MAICFKAATLNIAFQPRDGIFGRNISTNEHYRPSVLSDFLAVVLSLVQKKPIFSFTEVILL